MKRLIALAAAGALAAFAVVMPRPPEPELPDFGEVVEPVGGAIARPSVWYCPWLEAGSVRDSFLGVMTIPDADTVITLVNPLPGADPDERRIGFAGPVADAIDVGEIARRGQAPGFVEFSNGPAAATAVAFSDVSLAGDECVGFAPKTWHLVGGTTREGRQLTLRLLNPFPDNAKVTVVGGSEFGAVPFPELQSFDVPARGWRDVDLNPIVPFLDELTLAVTSDEGLVIPSFAMSGGADEAMWPGSGLSTLWEFPLTRDFGMTARVVVDNPGSAPVDVSVDVYTADGEAPIEDADVFTVEPSTPLEIDVGLYGGGAVGLRLRTSGAVAAALVAETSGDAEGGGEGGGLQEIVPPADLAALTGSVAPAEQWLLPGAGAVVDGITTIWMLNTGNDPATVTLLPLGEEEAPAEKVLVPPGSVLPLELETLPEIAGYFIESLAPISVAWSTQTQAGTVFVAGIAVGG